MVVLITVAILYVNIDKWRVDWIEAINLAYTKNSTSKKRILYTKMDNRKKKSSNNILHPYRSVIFIHYIVSPFFEKVGKR